MRELHYHPEVVRRIGRPMVPHPIPVLIPTSAGIAPVSTIPLAQYFDSKGRRHHQVEFEVEGPLGRARVWGDVWYAREWLRSGSVFLFWPSQRCKWREGALPKRPHVSQPGLDQATTHTFAGVARSRPPHETPLAPAVALPLSGLPRRVASHPRPGRTVWGLAAGMVADLSAALLRHAIAMLSHNDGILGPISSPMRGPAIPTAPFCLLAI